MELNLATQRLRLRRPRESDAARMAQLMNNFAIAGNLERIKLPFAQKDTAAWLSIKIATNDPHEAGFIITLDDDQLIGNVGFRRDQGETHIGYWLGEPYWGKGMMTEAVTAAIGWFFATTKADELNSGVFHFNMASLAIQHKLGFVEIGRSNVHCLARGQEVEHIDTELTRDTFETL